MKKIVILMLCIFTIGCKKEIDKDIAYVEDPKKDSKIVCILNNEDVTNGYKLKQIEEYIYDYKNILKSVNIRIEMDLLNDMAKIKLNSVIDGYKDMSELINNDTTNMYQGINMNVYYTSDRFEVSMYYDINLLNKEYIDKLEFKKYINDVFLFDIDMYKNDQNDKGSICNAYLQ